MNFGLKLAYSSEDILALTHCPLVYSEDGLLCEDDYSPHVQKARMANFRHYRILYSLLAD